MAVEKLELKKENEKTERSKGPFGKCMVWGKRKGRDLLRGEKKKKNAHDVKKKNRRGERKKWYHIRDLEAHGGKKKGGRGGEKGG